MDEPLPFSEDQRKNPPPRSFLDRMLRKFSRGAYVFVVLGLYLVASTALGLALAPALWVWQRTSGFGHAWPGALPLLWSAFVAACCFFIWGLALMAVVPLYNFVLPTKLKPFKGGYYTIHAVPWMVHNGLFYLVRFTFLPFATMTPFGIWFLKAMGMKIGRHAFINTEMISDPCLLELGDDSALGGSVRIFAHYGGGGNLVIAPVRIGRRATLGAGACVMGDVEVGEGAVVLPQSVLLPGTRIPPGETWGGVPAQPISREEMEIIKRKIKGFVDLG